MKSWFGLVGMMLVLAACAQQEQQAVVEPAVESDEGVVAAAEPHPGEAPYMENCASCHDQVVYKAPSRVFLGMMGPRNVLAALEGRRTSLRHCRGSTVHGGASQGPGFRLYPSQPPIRGSRGTRLHGIC